jgi:HAD superfamily hydrolase (TIGR01662 family)
MSVRAVVFDVGETLLDEARLRQVWADSLSVPKRELENALSIVIARREHHSKAFEMLRPSFDMEQLRRTTSAVSLSEKDLYPDALPCLTELKSLGYSVGVVGNQLRSVEAVFTRLPVSLDLVGSSERWGCAKPSNEFFTRLLRELSLACSEVAYVGDRVDNDVLPAKTAGMKAVFLRRGPWAEVQAVWPEAGAADLQLPNLECLPEALARL